MLKSTSQLVDALKKDKRLMGTCPVCDEEFRLADILLFAIGDDPPEAALAAIQAARHEIKDRKQELAVRRERMTKRAQKTAETVNIGKIVEKILPSFPSFSYVAGDCRPLYDPIDYLIFSGLTANSQVDSLVFVDVKSGNARLKDNQKSIKRAVETGCVSFVTAKGP